MGTTGWMLPTLLGCCLWILHGLSTAAAVPINTEGPLAAGTASPIPPESAVADDIWTAKSILGSPTVTLSFPTGAEPGLVATTSGYSSPPATGSNAALSPGEAAPAPTRDPQAVTNEVTSPNTTQGNQTASATAVVFTLQPNFTPSAEHSVTGTAPAATPGSSPVFAGTVGDVPMVGEGAGVQPTADAVILLSATVPTTAGTQPMTSVGPRVTVLPSQGLATAVGAAEEGTVAQWGDIASGTVGATLEPAALELGDVGDATDSAFSTANSSRLPAENVTVSATVENSLQSSLLAGQAGPSPAEPLAPGDGDRQEAPEVPPSGAAPAGSEEPTARGDTSLLGTDVQSDADVPAPVTGLPPPTGAVGLAEDTPQAAPGLSPTGELQPLLVAAPPVPTGTSSAPGAAFSPPVAGAVFGIEDGAEKAVSPDLGAAPGSAVFPSLGGSQPLGTAAGAPEEADGGGTGISSALDAPNTASSAPEDPASPAAGEQAQGDTGTGDTAQAGDAGDGSPYPGTQSGTEPAGSSTRQGPAGTTPLPAAAPGAALLSELSPVPAPGDKALAPAVSPPGPEAPRNEGLQPDLSGAGGVRPPPSQGLGAPGAAFLPPPAVDVFGTEDGAETAVSPDLGAAPGAPVSPSFGVSQPLETAAGAPGDAALPRAEGPGTGTSAALDAPSSAPYGPVGPPSPAFSLQPGPGLGVPGAEGQALGEAGSGAVLEPSLSSSAAAGLEAGTDLLPGAGSPFGPGSPGDAASSISGSDGAAAPIPAAAPGPDIPSPGSPYGESDPELTAAQGTNSAWDVAPAGNPDTGSPYAEQSPAAQQGPAGTSSLPAAASGAVLLSELSPVPAPGDGALAPAVSPPGPAAPKNEGLQPDLSGAGEARPPPSQGLGAPGAAFPPPPIVAGAAFGIEDGAETAVSADLGAAPGAPVSPPIWISQPLDTAAGAPEGTDGPSNDISSALDAPSSALPGPVGLPSPAFSLQPGPGLGVPGAEGQVLGEAGSGAVLEPSLSSSAAAGLEAGTDLLPGAGSPFGPGSPGDVLTASSISGSDGAAAPIPAAAPGPDVPFPDSPYGESDPELTAAQGTNSAWDVAPAGNPDTGSPYAEQSPAAQQGPAGTSSLPAAASGAALLSELSPVPAPGGGALAPAVSPPGPAAPRNEGLQPDLSGAGEARPPPSQSLGAPGAVFSPPPAVAGAAFGIEDGAETAVSPDLGAAPGAPVSPPFGVSQPLGTAAGAPEGADGPSNDISSALDAPSSALPGPVGPPSPAFSLQPGPGLGMLGAGGQALGEAGSGAVLEPSLSSSAAAGLEAGTDLLPGAGSPSGPRSPGDVLTASSISGSDGAAAPIPAAAPGPDVPSPGSPYGKSDPELTAAQGTNSAWDVAPAGNPDTGSPYAEQSPAAQQGPAGTSSLPAAASGAALLSELSPVPAPGDGALAPAVSPPGPEAPKNEGLQPDLSGAGGVRPPPSQGLGAPGAAFSPPPVVAGAAFGIEDGAETAVSPDLGAAPGAPVSPSFGVSQPLETAAGAPEGVDGPSNYISSALDAPSSALPGPVGPPSPAFSLQPGPGLGVPGAEGQALGEAGSGAVLEPSLSSSAAAGLEAGTDLLPGAGSPSGPGFPGDVLTASSVSNTASPGVPGGSGGAPSAPQPPLGAGSEAPPAAGEVGDVAEAIRGDEGALGQAQTQAGAGAAGASDRGSGPASSSPAAEGSSSLGAANGAAGGAGVPGPGGSSSPGSSAAGLQGREETPGLTPAIQNGASLRLSGTQLSQVNVVKLAGGKLGSSPSPSAGGGDRVGTVIQIASGVLAPSVLSSPQEPQPLGPAAPPASAGGVGGSSASNRAPPSISSAHGGSGLRALPAVLPGAGSTQPWSPEGEVASGVVAPVGEELPRAPAPPNAAPALPSVSQNLKEGAAAGPIPGLGGDQGGSAPPTLQPTVSCSPAPPAPGPADGKRLLGVSGAAALSSRASSSSVLPASRQLAAAPTPPPVPAVPAVPLYAYGARENDREFVERRVDFNSPLFKPEIGFPFGKTLRNSLYFTDNGQIIFPSSDSSVLTLPSPPAHGFTGREDVPIIAVFWDNADFSRGTGTTFYQEFLTLNSEKPPFVRDVEVKVRRYLHSSYSAAWTLKITWEKAPAYGTRGDSRRTNTYQAILTTDGFRSYVLMLYQDGGMRWDYTQLPAANVLIGYTSGDGYYRNDDLMQGPPAAKYRPDRFRGYNTDLRGLWLYKLESRVGANFRLKCLAWTGRQQDPSAWSQDLPTCPCSLQQGQQDPRFRTGRGGWWSARVSMLHSASPNQHGAGMRCLYDSRGQLIEGRQERYWKASRLASPYRDQELKLYNWCCNQEGSARLCARYSQKRPRVGCDGYQAPGTAADSSADSDSEEQGDDEEE